MHVMYHITDSEVIDIGKSNQWLDRAGLKDCIDHNSTRTGTMHFMHRSRDVPHKIGLMVQICAERPQRQPGHTIVAGLKCRQEQHTLNDTVK